MKSVWDGFAGHAEVRDAFERAIARGRLTQAYLFLGPDGVGKFEFARRLAQCILCERRTNTQLDACGECNRCRPFLAGNHPDFLIVERDPGKRELNVAKFVGERDQRGKAGLCYELSIRPVAGSRKIAIINDADTMNDEAANALLKTLEEPPDGAILFLVVSNLDALLPTIRSRCQSVRFGPLPDAEMECFATAEGLTTSPEEARLLASLAGGSRSVARRLAQPGFRELRALWLQALAQPKFDGMGIAKRMAEAVEKLAADTAEQRLLTNWLLQAAAEFYRSALRRLAGPQASPGTIPQAANWADQFAGDIDRAVDMLSDLLERCALATAHLEQNVSVGLCLEALCSDLARLARVR